MEVFVHLSSVENRDDLKTEWVMAESYEEV